MLLETYDKLYKADISSNEREAPGDASLSFSDIRFV
jgi:hypothetical protein